MGLHLLALNPHYFMEFLKELWERKAQSEKGVEVEKYPDIFIWKEQIKKDEFLKKLFDLVREKVERYVRTIKRRQEVLERFDKEGRNEETESELKSTDENQKLAHQALISAINFFVRNCERKGIKIDIDLEKVKNRDWSRDWAMKNAEIAKKIAEAEEKQKKAKQRKPKR